MEERNPYPRQLLIVFGLFNQQAEAAATSRTTNVMKRQEEREDLATTRRGGADQRSGATTTVLRPIPAARLTSGPGRAAKAALQASAMQQTGLWPLSPHPRVLCGNASI